MADRSTRRGKAVGWAAVLGVVGALTGAGVNGWVSMQEIEERESRDAYQRAQLEKVWEEVRLDARRRDEDLDRLREAVAEMKGALEQMHRGRMEHALRGGAVKRLLEKRTGRREKLEGLPEPEPERVQAARQAAE